MSVERGGIGAGTSADLPGHPAFRSRATNCRDLLPGVDGRSGPARRFRDIVLAVGSDQGGLEHLSEARTQLVRRFAAACVLAEAVEARIAQGEPVDVAEHAQLSSTLVRLGQRIGIDRRSRTVTPTLGDYLGGTYPEEADAAADDTEEAAP